MSEQLEISSSVSVVIVKSCPECGGQSFRVEYASLIHRLVCEKCGRWGRMDGFPLDQA